jgi:hypothetical protein
MKPPKYENGTNTRSGTFRDAPYSGASRPPAHSNPLSGEELRLLALPARVEERQRRLLKPAVDGQLARALALRVELAQLEAPE